MRSFVKPDSADSPCPARGLTHEELYQLRRELTQRVQHPEEIRRLGRLGGVESLAGGPPDVMWLEVLRQQVAHDRDLQPLLRALAPARPDAPRDAAAPSPAPAGSGAPCPTRRSLRQLIDEVILSDSDLDAFCLDHFLPIKRRFSAGMDRVGRLNLLLEQADPAEVLCRLREDYPEAVAARAHLLRF